MTVATCPYRRVYTKAQVQRVALELQRELPAPRNAIEDAQHNFLDMVAKRPESIGAGCGVTIVGETTLPRWLLAGSREVALDETGGDPRRYPDPAWLRVLRQVMA